MSRQLTRLTQLGTARHAGQGNNRRERRFHDGALLKVSAIIPTMPEIALPPIFTVTAPELWVLKEKQRDTIVVGTADDAAAVSFSVMAIAGNRALALPGSTAAWVQGSAEGFGAPPGLAITSTTDGQLERSSTEFESVVEKLQLELHWFVGAFRWPGRFVFATASIETEQVVFYPVIQAVIESLRPGADKQKRRLFRKA